MITHQSVETENRSLSFDVVICGGGLAGLTLARQLRLTMPNLSVALIDKVSRPIPEAAHKVGESSVEIGAHYFSEVLKLTKYFDEKHFYKFGLRYFVGGSHSPFEQRTEIGPSIMPPIHAFQIDRGRLENDLRELNEEHGVSMWEGCEVKDIELSDDQSPHRVLVRRVDQSKDEPLTELRAGWIVDASGRKRLLRTKLHLQESSGHTASAAWWRIPGRVDVSDFVDKSHSKWHKRVQAPRYFSTNHMLGRGYWVWLIPLSSNATSVGIVTDETMHPFATYGRSYEDALKWLEEYEPRVAQAMTNQQPMDFLGFRNFSYHTLQAFSSQRWSCVGEAALFADPYYSPGSDFIGISNTITGTLIKQHFEKTLTQETVDLYNDVYVNHLAPGSFNIYKGTYATFGHPQIVATKMYWDAASYWSTWAQIFFQKIFEDPQSLKTFLPCLKRARDLAARMQQVFIEWSNLAPPQDAQRFIDIFLVGPLLPMLHFDLHSKRSPAECLRAVEENLEKIEELAQAVFREIVSECYPEKVASLPKWLNVQAISLRPECWEADGLFAPASEPRDYSMMTQQVQLIVGTGTRMQQAKMALTGSAIHFAWGYPSKWLLQFFLKYVVGGRSGLKLRRLLYRNLFPARPTRPASNSTATAVQST